MSHFLVTPRPSSNNRNVWDICASQQGHTLRLPGLECKVRRLLLQLCNLGCNVRVCAWYIHSDIVNTNLIIKFIVMLILCLKVMREIGEHPGNSRVYRWIIGRTREWRERWDFWSLTPPMLTCHMVEQSLASRDVFVPFTFPTPSVTLSPHAL